MTELADGVLTFRLADPDRRYGRVRLDAGLGTAGPRPELAWADGVWSVTVELPPLHRVEYGFEVTRTITDPGGSGEVESGFGPRSVLELPGYQPPAWLGRAPEPGRTVPLPLALDGVTAWLWSAPGVRASEEASLLVVHDGPEYSGRGALTHYLGVLGDDGDIGPVRALLLTADPRDRLYAASHDYSDAVVADILPAVTARVPTGAIVAVGASLGALAAVAVQWHHPGTFDGLFLQSGSFFTPRTDPQERGFSGYERVTGLVGELLTEPRAEALPPTAITCGAHEENAANNAALAARLREVGVAVTHRETADLHNVTAWRDAYDPALRDLLRTVGV